MSRITGRYAINAATQCWEWSARRNATGYGVVSFNKERFLAHRLAYQTLVSPIPDGAIVCHTCDNPPCINPMHLFIGSHGDNAADKVAKRRHPRNTAKTCKNGHEYTAESSYIAVTTTGKRFRRCRICIRLNNEKRIHG